MTGQSGERRYVGYIIQRGLKDIYRLSLRWRVCEWRKEEGWMQMFSSEQRNCCQNLEMAMKVLGGPWCGCFSSCFTSWSLSLATQCGFTPQDAWEVKITSASGKLQYTVVSPVQLWVQELLGRGRSWLVSISVCNCSFFGYLWTCFYQLEYWECRWNDW